MTQKLKNYLNCSKWTISAKSSTYKMVYFTVHLHSVNEIHMKNCKLGFLFLKTVSLSPLKITKSAELRNGSSILVNRTITNIYEPKQLF